MKKIIFPIVFLFLSSRLLLAQSPTVEKEAANAYPDYLFEVTKIMVYDVISPPAAARYYAYACLAGYLANKVHSNNNPLDFTRELNGYRPIYYRPDPKSNASLASTYAMLDVARQMLPSGESLVKVLDQLSIDYKNKHKLSKKEITASIESAKSISSHVLAYAKEDNFNTLSAKTGYTPKPGPGYWYPTPPAYMAAIEPNWHTLRTFFLDSPTQFIPLKPTPFDIDPQSDFYQKELMVVYDAVNNLTPEQKIIANFWDCNPFNVQMTGHMAIGLKKITPGGHWLGIAGIACKQERYNLEQTTKTLALVALTLHDAFVSCWDEKYRSERIRPETVINQHIDESWRPILQTPPFPEYTSGHSVISGAASIMLTAIFGDQYKFTDDTEVPFDLPERDFASFEAAAQEAAISRLYGGIHYMDACNNGIVQGKDVGTFIRDKVF